jgi:hypothetical protein
VAADASHDAGPHSASAHVVDQVRAHDVGIGRTYARIYEGVQRRRHHEFIEHAVEQSGGRVLASSGPSRAPLFLGVEDERGERIGICAYAFPG